MKSVKGGNFLRLCLYGQITEFQLHIMFLTLDMDPYYSKYKDLQTTKSLNHDKIKKFAY